MSQTPLPRQLKPTLTIGSRSTIAGSTAYSAWPLHFGLRSVSLMWRRELRREERDRRRLGIRLATDDETEAAEKGRGSLAERLAAFFRVARPLVPKNGRRSVRKVRGSRRRPCYYKAL